MRDDMAKVVTERPRRGHSNPSKKTTGLPIRRYDPDADYDEPVRLPVSRGRQYGWNAKEFSDLINPLKRYLRSCVGRPIEQGAQRALAEAGSPEYQRIPHLGSRDVGNRNGLLHRVRPSRLQQQSEIRWRR